MSKYIYELRVSVTDAAAIDLFANIPANHRPCIVDLYNNGANNCFLGGDNTVTNLTGFKFLASTYADREAQEGATLYARCAPGAAATLMVLYDVRGIRAGVR